MTQPIQIQTVDPRTGEPAGAPVDVTGPDLMHDLLAAAHAAATPFGSSRPEVRVALLKALADRLDARAHELVPVAIAESGLPEVRLAGEVSRTSGQLRLFADVVADGAYREVIVDSARPELAVPQPRLSRWLEPFGPVEVFAASNFPFAFSVLGGDTASALAAGCPVIVKAHSSHAGLSRLVGDLASEVVAELGLPTGVFGLVIGDEAGLDVLRDPRVRAAGFTGSTVGGRYLFDVASGRRDPIPFYGELGSINPVVVTPGAVAARGGEIARGFVTSMTMGSGQFCTKPGLLFLPAGHGLEQVLADAVRAVAPAPLLNSRIADQLATGRSALSAHEAVSSIATGEAAPTDGSWASSELYATDAAALAAGADVLAAEYFGPNSVLVEYSSIDDLLGALRAVEGSLTATLHAEEGEPFAVTEVVGALTERAGRVIFNGWPTGVAVAWSMQHGGPWPATTNALHTSVGATAIRRWLRPVCYQAMPDSLLPEGLRSDNPWGLPRRVDGISEPQRGPGGGRVGL